MKDNNPGSLSEGTLLAVGGRYDYLLRQMWDHKYVCPAHDLFTRLSLTAVVH